MKVWGWLVRFYTGTDHDDVASILSTLVTMRDRLHKAFDAHLAKCDEATRKAGHHGKQAERAKAAADKLAAIVGPD